LPDEYTHSLDFGFKKYTNGKTMEVFEKVEAND
jgi:hypothetical protein